MPNAITEAKRRMLDIMALIGSDPNLTQRQLAKKAGISPGSVNFVLKGLIDKGFVKAGNFRKSSNKAEYLYLLTPAGVYQKARLTERFIQRRLTEYRALQAELAAVAEAGLVDVKEIR